MVWNPFGRKKFVAPEEKATTDTINDARKKYGLAQNQLGGAYDKRARALSTLNRLVAKLQDITLPKERREFFVEKGKNCERYINNIDKEIKNAKQQVSYSLNVLNNEISKFKKQTKSEADEKDILSNGVKNNLTKLETKIKSIENGQAPKPPTQTPKPVRSAPPPPGTIEKGQAPQLPQNNMGQQSQSAPQPRSEVTNIMDQAIPKGLNLPTPLKPIKPVVGDKTQELQDKRNGKGKENAEEHSTRL